MKVAVCFYGFLRTFKQTNTSIMENLVKHHNADVFIYTPDTFFGKKSSDPFFSIDDPDIVKPEYLKSVFGDNLKSFEIWNNDVNIFKEYVRSLPDANFMGQLTWRIFSMFYHIKNVIRLRKEYGNSYDVVILSRGDLELFNTVDLSNLDLNAVHYSGCHEAPVYNFNTSFGDHMMISSQKNIDVFESLYDIAAEYCYDGIVINNETLLGYHLLKNNIPFQRTDFVKHAVIR